MLGVVAAVSGATVLPLSEVFGPTVQGEGPYTGRRCGFVRLGLCNLACEWCDTPYTWDRTRYDVAAECPDTPVPVIADRVAGMGVDTVVLSGGEPLMHRGKLLDLFQSVPDVDWHVETNGTIVPPSWWAEHVTHTSVSPKLITADPVKKRIKPRALAAWADHAHAGRACFKFVAATPDDVDLVEEFVFTHDVPDRAVWVMPEGVTAGDVAERGAALADRVIAAGFNLSTRLHVLTWGDRRGV